MSSKDLLDRLNKLELEYQALVRQSDRINDFNENADQTIRKLNEIIEEK